MHVAGWGISSFDAKAACSYKRCLAWSMQLIWHLQRRQSVYQHVNQFGALLDNQARSSRGTLMESPLGRDCISAGIRNLMS